MSIFDRFIRRTEVPNTIRYQLSFDNPVVLNYDAKKLYKTQPNLRAVISFLAESVAQLPLKTYDRQSDTDRQRLTDSTAALLLARPNSYMTTFELIESSLSDFMLFGEFIWLVSPDADSLSGWTVLPISPSWVIEEHGGDAYSPATLEVKTRTGAIKIPMESLFVCHNYTPGKPGKGNSPVNALKQTLMEQIEADTYRRQVWKNGGRMSAYITRPKDVAEWTPEGAQRFKDDLKENWTNLGAKAGGMPVLEDGMEVKTVGFSAHEQEWATAKTLSREEVAGVYHVPPSVVWHTNGQTYASAKDNARALYTDTLAPILKRMEQRINTFLLPMIGEDSDVYVEFDLSAKLRGSFEEQAQVLQSSVGAPWLTRNEARALQNLPAIEGGDELVTPLNVLTGGLASPRDTASGEHFEKVVEEIDWPEMEEVLGLLKDSEPETKSNKSEEVEVKVAGHDDETFSRFVEVYQKLIERQSKTVLSAMGANPTTYDDDGIPSWWNKERWDRELAEDLIEAATEGIKSKSREVLDAVDAPDSDFDQDRTTEYVKAMCEGRAQDANQRTLELLMEAEENHDEDTRSEQRAAVFATGYERGERAGRAMACAVLGFAMLETIRQVREHREVDARKTWVVTSGNPRPSHRAMNGETVAWDETFSNGAQWPGDSRALDAADVANCQCECEVTIRRRR